MAEKKNTESDWILPETDPPVEEKPEEKAPFSVGEWHGHTQYQCSQCAFDCLDDEAAILEHIKSHRPVAERPPSEILVADRYGNIVKEE